MRKKKVWAVPPLCYLMAGAMVLMACASYSHSKILFLVELTTAGIALLAVGAADLIRRRDAGRALRGAKRVLTGEEVYALEEFGLPVTVVGRAGEIVWANKIFADTLGHGRDFVGENVLRYIYPKTFRQVMGEKGAAVSHGGREYTVYGAKAKEGYLLYFVDDTYFKAIHKEYREKKPVVGLAVFDNREELLRDSMGGENSQIAGEVDSVLYRWVTGEMGGFIRKLSDNRYLFLTDESHLEQAKQRRFKVLDDVREIKSSKNNRPPSHGARNSSTISIVMSLR